MISVFYNTEIIVGKEVGYQQISPFPTMFSRGFFLSIVRESVNLLYGVVVFPTYFLNNPFPNKPWFSRVCSTSLLKPLREKEKLLVTSNFSFSHSIFYTFEELSAIFIKFKIVVCKLFQFGRV